MADLVARPDLATEVLAGASGVDRAVHWAHVCELEDPWQWVGGGDLLMTTGLGVPSRAVDQVRYVERLAAVGAAGVAVGRDMNAPPLRRAMLAAADRHALPLLLTRREIPFIALARAVAESASRLHQRRIDQTERVYEVLRRSSAVEQDLASLLGLLAEVAGCRLLLVDLATQRSLVPGEVLPAPLLAPLGRWPVEPGEDVVTLDPGDPGDPSVRVTAVGVTVPAPRATVLVAWTEEEPLPDGTVLRHVAAAAALHQARVFAERERSLRLGASLLAQLLDQRITPDAARDPLAAAGLEGPLVLAACQTRTGREDLHLLDHHLTDAEVPHLVLTRPPLTLVLLRAAEPAVTSLAAWLAGVGSAGVSDAVTSVLDLPTALGQARWALHRAQERRLPLLHHADEQGSSAFLPGDREDARAAARRVLGPVLLYDETHRSRLVDSLRAFLEEDRSWLRAAERLHVHKQTLAYRLRRVEALTSRRLGDTGDVAELWLALQAATVSGLVERHPLPDG